jgi:hypothetical protein
MQLAKYPQGIADFQRLDSIAASGGPGRPTHFYNAGAKLQTFYAR